MSCSRPLQAAETARLQRFLEGRKASPHSSEKSGAVPLVSIVMPSLNQGRYIETAIRSVLNQSYPNIELIVIDGGSTDETVRILRSYGSDLRFFVGADRGQSHALNKGFALAQGAILGWLNSDDLYTPGSFSAGVDALLRHPEKSVVFGDYWLIDASGHITERVYAFDFSLRQFIYEGFHLNAQACFWRRDLMMRFGEFDESLHRTMDYEMLLRFGLLSGQEAFHRIEEALACFRRHPLQKTVGFDQVVESELRYVAKKHDLAPMGSIRRRVVRQLFRGRRVYWYVKRGGIRYLLRRWQRLGQVASSSG